MFCWFFFFIAFNIFQEKLDSVFVYDFVLGPPKPIRFPFVCILLNICFMCIIVKNVSVSSNKHIRACIYKLFQVL